VFIPIAKLESISICFEIDFVLIAWKLRPIAHPQKRQLFQYPTRGQNILDVIMPGEAPEKGDKGRLRIIATGSGLIEICLVELACPFSICTVAAPCVLIVACALTIAAQC
jgi:hypothetical protein